MSLPLVRDVIPNRLAHGSNTQSSSHSSEESKVRTAQSKMEIWVKVVGSACRWDLVSKLSCQELSKPKIYENYTTSHLLQL